MKKKGIIIAAFFFLILLFFNSCSKNNPGTPEQKHGCAYAFGNNADNDTSGWTGGYLFACPFTMSSNVTIDELAVKLTGTAGSLIIYEAGIYADNSGVPADLIAQTGKINGAPGWNAVTTTAVALNSGNTYWLVAVSENPGISDLPGSGSCKYAPIYWPAFASGLPADLNSISWNPLSDEIKVYAMSCE
jgi:hypothetical protein